MSNEIFVAWHGSPHTFNRFDFSKLRDSLGAFFTESKEAAEYYGTARQYRLTFQNVLRVHQGEEYAKWVAKHEGETDRDVRRRLMAAGHDGVRIEYDGGVVEYVAFSNRNITPINQNATIPILPMPSQQRHTAKIQDSFALRAESKRLLDLAKRAI